jgi:hypothetical protein
MFSTLRQHNDEWMNGRCARERPFLCVSDVVSHERVQNLVKKFAHVGINDDIIYLIFRLRHRSSVAGVEPRHEMSHSARSHNVPKKKVPGTSKLDPFWTLFKIRLATMFTAQAEQDLTSEFLSSSLSIGWRHGFWLSFAIHPWYYLLDAFFEMRVTTCRICIIFMFSTGLVKRFKSSEYRQLDQIRFCLGIGKMTSVPTSALQKKRPQIHEPDMLVMTMSTTECWDRNYLISGSLFCLRYVGLNRS